MPADVLPYIESTWLINMTNLTYSSQCNSWRPGRSDDKGLSSLPASLYKRKFEEFSMNGGPGFNKKNSSHLCDEFPYSAIQLPAAISIWESSGFHSSMVCGSRRQYFVFAPHQAFACSFCILYLFLAI